MNRFLCLMKSGIPLPNKIADFLVDTAVHMNQNQIERQRIQSETCEGEVRTEFKPYVVTSVMSGIMFTATIHYTNGKTEVSFLVDPDNPGTKEDCDWVDLRRIGNSGRRSARYN